jgi:hypothetical protein
VHGPARATLPGDDRLALVGDADGARDLAPERLPRRGERRLPDFLGIVLDPPRLGVVLADLAVAAAEPVVP